MNNFLPLLMIVRDCKNCPHNESCHEADIPFEPNWWKKEYVYYCQRCDCKGFEPKEKK